MDEQSIAKLVEDFHKDFLYNCHSVVRRYNQSPAKNELVKIGTRSFPALAYFIKSNFGDLKTADKCDVNWDLFGYMIWLVCEIIETYNLPQKPYSSMTPFGSQDMEKWYVYCIKYQT